MSIPPSIRPPSSTELNSESSEIPSPMPRSDTPGSGLGSIRRSPKVTDFQSLIDAVNDLSISSLPTPSPEGPTKPLEARRFVSINPKIGLSLEGPPGKSVEPLQKGPTSIAEKPPTPIENRENTSQKRSTSEVFDDLSQNPPKKKDTTGYK